MEDFKRLLDGAKRGTREDMECLLAMYNQLINRVSTIDNHIDADLRQHLTMAFILAVMKFKDFE